MKVKLFENVILKLVALVLSIIIWFLVVGEEKSEVRLTVPLELRNLPTNLEIIESISQVEVAVRGFSSVVKQLTPSDIDAHIDLSNVLRGKNSFSLMPEALTVPVGVTVIQVSPSDIEVTLDATVKKTVTVEPIIRGTPLDGYVLEAVTVKPNTVTVSGAQSLLKNITKVDTETVSVEGIDAGFEKKVKVRPPNSALRIEKEEERTVTVHVQVAPEMTERFFENIPLLVKEEKRLFSLSPDSVTALVHGPKLELLNMEPKDIPAYVETNDLPVGQSSVQVRFELPENMSVTIHYPKKIVITLAEE